jgi:hypothetical protein
MLSAPLILGCDLDKLDNCTLGLVNHKRSFFGLNDFMSSFSLPIYFTLQKSPQQNLPLRGV